MAVLWQSRNLAKGLMARAAWRSNPTCCVYTSFLEDVEIGVEEMEVLHACTSWVGIVYHVGRLLMKSSAKRAHVSLPLTSLGHTEEGHHVGVSDGISQERRPKWALQSTGPSSSPHTPVSSPLVSSSSSRLRLHLRSFVEVLEKLPLARVALTRRLSLDPGHGVVRHRDTTSIPSTRIQPSHRS